VVTANRSLPCWRCCAPKRRANCCNSTASPTTSPAGHALCRKAHRPVPALSNTVCLRLDCRLSGLSQKLGFRYTRYADDLTFSWHETDPPPLGRLLRCAFDDSQAEGFIPRTRKKPASAPQPPPNRDRFGGQRTPSGSPARIPRVKLRQLRAALHNRLQRQARQGEGESLAQLRGWVAYLHMTDPERAKPFLAQLNQLEARGADE
jgi:RNA-directed DNA polymerase